LAASRRLAVGPYPAWLPWAVLGLGAASRLLRLGEWSLWFDEETSIYFALNPARPFPRAFPLYFWLLGRLFALTGVSVYQARLLSAIAGIATLWLAWRSIRRFAGDEVALPALVLLILSPGHLFWSQSIRYYMLLLVFQLASVHAFLRALEERSVRWWVLAVGWLGLALLTNTTAVLLVPVYVIALVWTPVSVRTQGRAARATLITALTTVVLACAALAVMLSLHAQFGDQERGVWTHLVERFVAYAGVPAIVLMIAGVMLTQPTSPGYRFFFLLATVPVLELMLLQSTGLWSVAWYHGLVALVGVAAMGGFGWKVLTERAPAWITACSGGFVIGASLVVVVSYFTTAHGDRPRWKEAAAILRQHHVVAGTSAVDVFSNAPGVIAFYLGVPPGETMGHPLVRLPPQSHAPRGVSREGWFVLEQRLVRGEWRQWLDRFCEQRGAFPGALILRDRTVLVYQCVPSVVRFEQ
jgi:dolichyl-phosphate-mannose-protein mannosyltransferase